MNAIIEIKPSFREMHESDLEQVLIIEEQGHRYPWSEGIFRDCIRVGYYCPLLVLDDRLVGYGVMSIAVGEAHIFNVCVAQEFRQKGFGLQIMQHLLTGAKNNKCKSAFLEVRPSNVTAIRLYENLGFVEVGSRKDYYPTDNGREDAIIMALDFLYES